MILHPIIDRLKTIAELLPTAIGGEFVPSGTKQISITENGTTTENVFSYADAEITVNVQSGGIVPTGTKQISITQNGTTTEDVTNYANAEITVNVPIGPSLPSSISKIDGGSFTVESDTQCATYSIQTSLGEPAKYFLIWTDDLNSFGAIANKGLISALVNIRQFNYTSSVTRYGYYSYLQRQTDGNSFHGTSTMNYANNPETFTNSTMIRYYVNDTYYIADKTYKWIAWS